MSDSHPYRPGPPQPRLPWAPPEWLRSAGSYVGRFIVGLLLIALAYALLFPVPLRLGALALELVSFDYGNRRPDQIQGIQWFAGVVLESTVLWVPRLGTWWLNRNEPKPPEPYCGY